MDVLILWLAALTVVSLATAALGFATFLLTVLGLWRAPGQKEAGTTVYMWDHRRAAVLAEKPTFVTSSGRFAPVELTSGEIGKLRKLAGMRVKVVYIVEEPSNENAKSATHVYP